MHACTYPLRKVAFVRECGCDMTWAVRQARNEAHRKERLPPTAHLGCTMWAGKGDQQVGLDSCLWNPPMCDDSLHQGRSLRCTQRPKSSSRHTCNMSWHQSKAISEGGISLPPLSASWIPRSHVLRTPPRSLSPRRTAPQLHHHHHLPTPKTARHRRTTALTARAGTGPMLCPES